MGGAVILVVAMIIAIPFGLFVAGACWSALLGNALEAYARSEPAAGPAEPGATG